MYEYIYVHTYKKAAGGGFFILLTVGNLYHMEHTID